ncbi:MAG: hypothetical protein VKI83_08145 [Synechococcaceae cyanobacterium]|nr:hypothetical protein [Synechococcaceae cyanobacterium]
MVSTLRLPDRLASLRQHLLLVPVLAAPLALPEPPAHAQAQNFMLGPGSNVGPSTKVVPVNCRKNPDGSTTCDTKLENDPSDTPAKPSIDVFKN